MVFLLPYYPDVTTLKADSKNNNLIKLLNYEISNKTTKLPENIERKLNLAGLTDQEIAHLDKKTLDLIKEGNNFSADVKYYKVDEEDIYNKSKNYSVNITGEELDNLINDVYDNSGKWIQENKKANKVSVLESMGFIPITAKAVDNIQTSSCGYLKQVISIVQSTGDRCYVSYTAYWLKNPKNRQVEVYGVITKNLTPVVSTSKNYYTAVSDAGANINYKGVQKNETTGIAVTMNMRQNILGDGFSSTYKKQIMHLGFYATIDSRNSKRVSASGHYYHQQSQIQFTPSVSIGSTGFSFANQLALVNTMKEMLPNPLSSLTIK